MKSHWLFSLAIMAAGCTSAPAGQAPPARGAETELRNANGTLEGRVSLTAIGADSTRIFVRLTRPAPGPHGVHVHEVGLCDPPDFTTAGGHLNPYHRQHGRLNPAGPHAGDAGNVQGSLDVVLAVPFDSIMDADGSAIIVHAASDDERTDPSGNSGTRMFCGVVGATAGRRTAP